MDIYLLGHGVNGRVLVGGSIPPPVLAACGQPYYLLIIPFFYADILCPFLRQKFYTGGMKQLWFLEVKDAAACYWRQL